MEPNNPQPPVYNPGQQQQPPQVPQWQQPMPQYPYPNQAPIRELPQMSFIDAIKTCFAKYADFSGRARRSEFWWWILFMSLCSMVMSSLCVTFGMKALLIGSTLLSVALLCPLLAVQTRRLHDTGRSGWIVLITAIFYAVYMASYVKLLWPIMDKLQSDPLGASEALQESMGSLSIALSLCGLAYSVLMLVLFIFNLQDSHREENKYGPSPKYQ